MKYENILLQIEDIKSKKENVLLEVCKLLDAKIAHFNWVGFYRMNHNKSQLEIGPYVGEISNHTVIPFGKGICGQVAESGKTFLVEDTSEESNYLSCSVKTKAEIVIPIYSNEVLVGQLDIDSHYLNPFSEQDLNALENICKGLGDYF